MRDLRDLMRLAATLGLLLEWRPLGDVVRGYYQHALRAITLNSELPLDLLRSALAHELGHAHYGHIHSDDPDIRERQERLADRYAAELLISKETYRAAERLVEAHPGAIAIELGVARYVVDAWRETHTNTTTPWRVIT